MVITISIYVLVVVAILSFMGGFWLGRSVKWMMLDTESRIDGEEGQESEEEQSDADEEEYSGKMRNGAKRITQGWAIGSPVGGVVRCINDGTRRGALIQPEQGILHAPVSGKVIRLFPMGNRMLIRADSGVEILLCVGEAGDEMHSVYYRTHVVQNEIITKGKILLEFDRDKMHEEGVDTVVSVMVETADDYRDIMVTRKTQVRAGEELLRVRENKILERQLK